MFRIGLALVALAFSTQSQATTIGRDGERWTLENDHLVVSLDASTGAVSVFDKETGARYQQPDSVRDKLECAPGEEVVVLPATTPVVLDGRLDEWVGTRMLRLDPSLLSDEKPWQLDGDRDLSAAVGFRWDNNDIHALFIVADDVFAPGNRTEKQWWEADSVEWWIGWDQAGFMLDPTDPGGFLWGDWKDWARAAVRPVSDFATEAEALALADAVGLDFRGRHGYVVETSTHIGALITLQPVAAGRRFRLACGVNDADEPGKRAAQEYFPSGYHIGLRSTYAVAVLAEADGSMPSIPDGRPPLCSEVRPEGEDGLTFLLAADLPEATVGKLRCTIQLREGSRELHMTVSFVEGWRWSVPLCRGFLPESEDAEYVMAPYGNGLLIAADNLEPPLQTLSVFGTLDMPAVGIVSSKGSALCLFQDYDYASAQLHPALFGNKKRLALLVNEEHQKGERLPAYHVTWYFASENGLAPLANRVREFCEAQGWVKTLREKLQTNPNVDRLIGAPDVWGSSGLQFAQEARLAGIDHLLVSGSYPRDQIEGIKALGYLVGEYDQYVDTDESTESYDGRNPVEAYIRIQQDGTRAKGWVLLDGSHTWFSRCSETALAGAQHKIAKVLAEHPYNARFLDVHTAISLVECYSAEHPCTRTEDRENKIALLQWIRDQGLVIGGEHGRAWSVGVLDYQEGMMSHSMFCSWPAGHLVKVEKPEQISDQYLKWGIGYETRVPFWELAFHDCVVSTWYWGDSIGYFERVRPDLTDRKVAFTALYGAAPLMWATDLCLGFTGHGKTRFLEAYRNCCKIQEAVGYERMLSHEFLTKDRSVQRTRFSDGTTVTVNFGPEPARIESGGKTWLVPTNGIVADGPTIHQHIALVNGRKETYIERPGYRFLDSQARREMGGIRAVGPVTAQRVAPGRIRVSLEPGTREAAISPRILDEAFNPEFCRLVSLTADLKPQQNLPIEKKGGWLVLPVQGTWRALELLYGEAVAEADIGIERASLSLPIPTVQGVAVTVEATLRNYGGKPAQTSLVAYWDAIDQTRVAGKTTVTVPAGKTRKVTFPTSTAGADGDRELLLVAESGAEEIVLYDNRVSMDVTISPDFNHWPWRIPATLDLMGIERTDAVVECGVDLTRFLEGKALDPGSVRLALADQAGEPTQMLDTQFEPAEDFDPRTNACGTLLAILPGEYQGEHAVRCVILAAPTEGGPLAPGRMGFDPHERTVTRYRPYRTVSPTRREGYRANISDGAIRPLSYLSPDGEAPLIRQIVFSSMETGWGESEGKLTEFTVLSDGPVRTRIRTVKELRGGLVVTRIYSFYPHYFTVEASAPERQSGLFSRVWYSLPGTYEDDRGEKRNVNGEGKDEGVTSNYPDPKWYCFYNDRASHACIALTPMAGQSFWDDGSSLGQLGFATQGASGTYAHIIAGPQTSSQFAHKWYESLTRPPVLRLQ